MNIFKRKQTSARTVQRPVRESVSAKFAKNNPRPKFGIWDRFKLYLVSKSNQPPSKQFGMKLREQRAKQQREVVLSRAAERGKKYLKYFLYLLLVAVAMGAAGVGVYYLHHEQVYIIKEINVEGNKAISELEIVTELSDLKGKSLLTFSSSEIENRLKAKFPYIKEAFVRKVLPGELDVQIRERFPTSVYVNLSGSYLIDDDRVVVGIIVSDNTTTLTGEETLILNGFGDLNSNYVFEKYISKFQTDDEKSKVVWEQVSDKDKQAALDALKTELQAKVDAAKQAHEQAVVQAGWTTLRLIEGNDSVSYNSGDSFSQIQFELVRDVAKYMQEQQLPVSKYLWQSDFSLDVQMVNGQQILLTTTKPLDRQLAALDALRQKTNVDGARVIDLRSELVSVR